MVKIISIIPTISFFLFFGEIESYDAVPADFTKKVNRQREEVMSSVNTLTETIQTGFEAISKGADETNRFAIQSCSDSVTRLGDHLAECLRRDDVLISLSTKLDNFQGKSNNMGSVWVTIQIFSGINLFGILCTLAMVGYILYQRSMITQLLKSQNDSCSNCTRLNSIACDQLLNLSTTHSPTHSSTRFLPGGTPTSTPAPVVTEIPPPQVPPVDSGCSI